MALLLSTRHIVIKMDEKVKRVDNRLDDYIKDSNENNIHDIRTAVRRLGASYRCYQRIYEEKTKLANT